MRQAFLLLVTVFIISTCGLVYELIAGTLASYLLGDSVTQFSTVIGVYLFSMGIGSFLSRYVERNLPSVFVQVELLIGIVGGSSAALLFSLFEVVSSFRVLLYGLVALTGILVGLEIPLLMRLLRDRLECPDLVSQIFTFDYVGALLASLIFPLVLVPHLGLVRSGFMFGLINAGVALWSIHLLRDSLRRTRLLRIQAVAVMVLLALGFASAGRIMRAAEAMAYPDPVILARSTPYQRIVLTKGHEDLRLFLNGNLQFSSRDEYRYHEALVHVGLSTLPHPRKVLVIGGGDGLAVREILKHRGIESIRLVDLDPAMTGLFSTHPVLRALNRDSLRSPRVRVISADAFTWLRANRETFDFIVVDLPDPSNFSIGKLYTTAFDRQLLRALAPEGLAVVQSTSPFVARKSFWCIDATLRAVGFRTAPYHCLVPSFGEWGYVLASRHPFQPALHHPPGLRFVTPGTVSEMLRFPPDMDRVEVEPNRLDNQVLVHLFDEEWSSYVR